MKLITEITHDVEVLTEDGTNRARNEYQRATPGQPSWDGDPEINKYYKNVR